MTCLSKHYRDLADELRSDARAVTGERNKVGMLSEAENYDRMAKALERFQSHQPSTSVS
jgi:hypothetical protein